MQEQNKQISWLRELFFEAYFVVRIEIWESPAPLSENRDLD